MLTLMLDRILWPRVFPPPAIWDSHNARGDCYFRGTDRANWY